MKRNFIFLFISVIYLGACSKSSSEIKTVASESQAQQTDLVTAKGVTYFIPQGAHYCIPNPLTFTSQSVLSFKAVFDSSCIYTTTDPLNQYDINKLYGFSDCNDQHLTNSVRIGWRWSNDSLRIFSFVHNQGVMLMNEITTAKIGAVVRCRITCLINTYSFEVNGKTTSVPRHCSGNYTRYKLYPYFGGDETAPHDISIKITELSN